MSFLGQAIGVTRTDEVEAAVIALLTAGLAGAGITNIGALSDEDFDEDDRIAVPLPAARVSFADETFAAQEEMEYLSYRSNQDHVLLVGASRPSTADIERGAAQNVLELAKNILAGARLALSSNPDGATIGLLQAGKFRIAADGTWYAIRFRVASFTQFTANIGSIR